LKQYSRQLGPWRVFYKAGQLVYRKKIGTASWVREKAEGKNPDPRLSTVALFLRACGAHWDQFTDLLEGVDVLPIDMEPIVEAGFPERELEKFQDASDDQQIEERLRGLGYIE
jgi:hypothetical protein